MAKITKNCLDLVKEFEGCYLRAYKDEVGVWTIGYGITNSDKSITKTTIKSGLTISKATAESWLEKSLTQKYLPLVMKYNDKYKWNQNEIDALVSFCYNIGSIKGLTANGTRSRSTIASKMMEYNKAGGRVYRGLTRRRTAEKKLFSGIVVFIAAATTLKAGMDKFFTTFEITPPWEKSKKEEKEYRKDVRNQLTDLKQQESDFEKTQLNYRSKNEKTTKEILESISILSEDIKSLRKQIEDMELERKIKKYRWDLNNFATQLSRDVRYGKDQFDIIFQEHEEYESLLREHNMTNGQTTIAMDIIRKYYKKLYFDGNNQN